MPTNRKNTTPRNLNPPEGANLPHSSIACSNKQRSELNRAPKCDLGFSMTSNSAQTARSKKLQAAPSSRCEPLQEFGAPDRTSTKRFEVRRQNLDIEPVQATLCKMIDQVQEGQVRSIRFEMKHAFTGKRATGIDAIDAARQTTVAPGLYTMRMAQTVKLQIRGLHLRRDPGT